MKENISGLLLILAGPACLGIMSGDPSRPSLLAIPLALSCWVAAGFAFAGRKRGVNIVTAIVVLCAAISILVNPLGWQAPNLRGSIIIFFVNGGLAAILAIFASLLMPGSTVVSKSTEPPNDG